MEEIERDEDENETENVTMIRRDVEMKMRCMKKRLRVKRRRVKGNDEIQRMRDVEIETLEKEENDDLIEKIDSHHVLRT